MKLMNNLFNGTQIWCAAIHSYVDSYDIYWDLMMAPWIERFGWDPMVIRAIRNIEEEVEETGSAWITEPDFIGILEADSYRVFTCSDERQYFLGALVLPA